MSVGELSLAFNLFWTMALDFIAGNTGVDDEERRYFAWVCLMGTIRLRPLSLPPLLFDRKDAAEMERSAMAFLALTRLPPLGTSALEMGDRKESVGLE